MYLNLREVEDKEDVSLSDFLKGDFHSIPPFSPVLIDYCKELSKRLSNHDDADMAALGFWLRPSHIHELKEAFTSHVTERHVLVPKGLVFHITASNVDTLFAYSWALSLLCGNANIVRLPSIQSSAITTTLEIIQEILEQERFRALNVLNCFVHYGHQESITAQLSSQADVRMIWGSNPTIQTLRNIPLAPYATEIVFPDRFSYAVIEAGNYQKLSDEQKRFVAKSFFRDAYGFDQNGCSSPRLLFWIHPKGKIREAVEEFSAYLQEEISSRGYELPLSAFLNKQTDVYTKSSQLSDIAVSMPSNELTSIIMKQFDPLCRSHPGAGLFYHIPLQNLADLAQVVDVRDQTVTYEGFELHEIKHIALSLNGRGPSRWVPFGEALRFSANWDGHDLLGALTRKISV